MRARRTETPLLGALRRLRPYVPQRLRFWS